MFYPLTVMFKRCWWRKFDNFLKVVKFSNSHRPLCETFSFAVFMLLPKAINAKKHYVLPAHRSVQSDVGGENLTTPNVRGCQI